MTTTPKKPSLPPRLAKRKSPLGAMLSKIPGLKGLVDQKKEPKATPPLSLKPQKMAAGGAAKVRLGQIKIKGLGASFKSLPKGKKKS